MILFNYIYSLSDAALATLYYDRSMDTWRTLFILGFLFLLTD